MDISGIREALQAFYEAQNKKTAGRNDEKKLSFENMVREAVSKEGRIFPEGEDVVMSHPPLYTTQYNVDMNKSKEDMTLDEYKQYICNVVSGLPVSASMKVSSSGTLIFKEEAFESMKNNPEYEKKIINMLREKYSREVPANMPNVSYQVIGASEEECYGSAIPIKNFGLLLAGMNTSASGLNGLGSLGASALGLAGLGSLSTSALGLTGLGSLGTSALGLTGLGSLGTSVPGLVGLGNLGTSALGLTGLGTGTQNTDSAGRTSVYGARRTNMINAYKKSAAGKNGNTSIRNYKSR